MKYEIPELSHRFGAFVTAETLSDAQRIARENGCDAVWEVELLHGMVPLLTGHIHAYAGGVWRVVPKDGPCSCRRCKGKKRSVPMP
jgi:hypothetical protein